MDWRSVVQVLAVVLAGLIAGLVVGTGIEQHSLRALPGPAWVQEHQVMDAWFRVVMPPFWNATVLILLLCSIISRGPTRWIFGIAAAFLLASLVVTIRVEVPMNRLIATWNADLPPAGWAQVRDRWLAFHRIRAVSSVVAFVLATLALCNRTPEPLR